MVARRLSRSFAIVVVYCLALGGEVAHASGPRTARAPRKGYMSDQELRTFGDRVGVREVHVRFDRKVEHSPFRYQLKRRAEQESADALWELVLPGPEVLHLTADLASAELAIVENRPHLAHTFASRALAFRRVLLSRKAITSGRYELYELDPDEGEDAGASPVAFAGAAWGSLAFDVIRSQRTLHHRRGPLDRDARRRMRRDAAAGLARFATIGDSYFRVLTGKEWKALFVGLARARELDLLPPPAEATAVDIDADDELVAQADGDTSAADPEGNEGEVEHIDLRDSPVRLAEVYALETELSIGLARADAYLHDPARNIADVQAWRSEIANAQNALDRLEVRGEPVLIADHRKATPWHVAFAHALSTEVRADPDANLDVVHGRAMIRTVLQRKLLLQTPARPLQTVIGAVLANAVRSASAGE